MDLLNRYHIGKNILAFSTTRHGGCSKGNYAGFNINCFCGDDVEDIRKNRETLCSLLGIDDRHLLMPHQVHLTKTVRIDEALLTLSEEEKTEALEGYDALMTNLSGVCIGVSTADCIPVLLCDESHHAVCAIHAGWRGTAGRIVEKALAEMGKAYGTRPEQVKAQIGPGIHLESFEVGDEVYETFLKEGFDMKAISKKFPAKDSSLFHLTSSIKKDSSLLHLTSSLLHLPSSLKKWHIDLPECNRLQLRDSGVPESQISVSPVCTFQQSADYFSARRLGINSGRIFTGIMIQEQQNLH